MIFKGKLSDLVAKASTLPWNLWVYSESFANLGPDTQCMVLDADNAELGSDDFTPLEVEACGYQELISMQDLQVIVKNTDSSKIINAIDYYVKNDAFL
jgi:hypothetical protein